MNNELLKLENQLCFSVYATSRSITKIYRPFLDELGLTYPQYLVMLLLWEHGTVTLKDLGNKLYLDSGTLTPLLKRLESLTLIKRQRSTEDERLLCVTLTEKGIALKEQASRIPECVLKSMNAEFSDLLILKKELDSLLTKLNKE
jgi:DNA-binding MarR family transcriptional regulator